MKRFIILTLTLATCLTAYAQQNFKVLNGTVKILGTSSMHDWTADVKDIDGSGTLMIENNQLTGINSLTIKMDVKSIKSEKGSMMDKNIYKALKDKDHPSIKFVMTKVNSITETNGAYRLNIAGKLTIAGTTKTVNLIATGSSTGNGKFVFKGEKTLKMTDYNVEPPEFMFGAMSTGDDVTIKFETTLQTNMNAYN